MVLSKRWKVALSTGYDHITVIHFEEEEEKVIKTYRIQIITLFFFSFLSSFNLKTLNIVLDKNGQAHRIHTCTCKPVTILY